MIIAIDLDEVLVDIITPLLEYHNGRSEETLEKEDVHTYYLEDVWDISREETMRRISEFYNSERFLNMDPMPDAKIAIEKLTKDHELFIVTSRPEVMREKTEQWIRKHFPDTFNDIHLSFNKTFEDSREKYSKAEICLKIDADVFVEDSAEYANQAAEKGIKTFLMNRPWNLNEEIHDSIKRVNSWREILEAIE